MPLFAHEQLPMTMTRTVLHTEDGGGIQRYNPLGCLAKPLPITAGYQQQQNLPSIRHKQEDFCGSQENKTIFHHLHVRLTPSLSDNFSAR